MSAAIAAGPGLVVLVGPEGSGKTTVLSAFAASAAHPSIALRHPDEDLRPEVAVDMIDPVIDDLLHDIVEPAVATVRVLAARPGQLRPILGLYPPARLIPMRPMTKRDLHVFVDARRNQLRRSADARMLQAIAKLTSLSITDPGTLDRLIGQICPEFAAGSPLAADLPRALPAPKDRRRAGAPPFDDRRPDDLAFLGPDLPSRSAAATGQRPWRAATARAFAAKAFAPYRDPSFQPALSAGEQDARDVQTRSRLRRTAEPSFEATSWDILRSSSAEIVQAAPPTQIRRRTVIHVTAGAAGLVIAAGVYAAIGPWPAATGGSAPPTTTSGQSGPPRSPAADPVPSPSPLEASRGNGPANRSLVEPAALPAPALPAPALPEPALPARAPPAPAPPQPSPVLADPVPAKLAPEPENPAPAGTGLAGMPEPAARPPADPPAQLSRQAQVPVPAKDPVHLLRLGKALQAIGQQADAQRLFEASAKLGNAEAKALLSARPRPRTKTDDAPPTPPSRPGR